MRGACLGVLLGLVLGSSIGGYLGSLPERSLKESPPGVQHHGDTGANLGRAVDGLLAPVIDSVRLLLGIVMGGILGAILGAVGGAGAATRQRGRAVSPSAVKPPSDGSLEPPPAAKLLPDESLEPDRMIHSTPSFLVSPPDRSAERDQVHD
jgi:hypothetical protein